MHVYRWDLDRTYLDTAIDSVRGLIRSALEDASTKRALPGATSLLRGLVDAHPDSHICILSGSPLQMRPVLEEKLTIDGIRFDKLILKDNLGNLRRGRLRALRGQVAYKLPALLVERQHTAPDARETLFGDDSEADALIYVAFAELLAGRLDVNDMRKILVRSGAYPDRVDIAVRALTMLPRRDVVDDVFIRLDKRMAPGRFALLGPLVVPVHHWLQAALVLWRRGRLEPKHVADVASEVAHGAGGRAVAGMVQDAVRRGLVSSESMETLMEAPELRGLRGPVHRALTWLPNELAPPLPRAPDLFGFLDQLQKD